MTPVSWGPEKGRTASEERVRWIVRQGSIEEDALTCGCPHRCFQYPEVRFYIICMKIMGKNDIKWTV
jgi:hypothetical protein